MAWMIRSPVVRLWLLVASRRLLRWEQLVDTSRLRVVRALLRTLRSWFLASGSDAPCGAKCSGSGGKASPNLFVVSVLGRSFQDTPLVVTVRGHLDAVKRFMKGDYYIGRGCRQCSLGCSPLANPFKVAKHGRERAIELFTKHLNDDISLRSSIWMLSGLRLLCHCGLQQSCHADALISAFSHDFPEAYDRHDTSASVPYTSAQLKLSCSTQRRTRLKRRFQRRRRSGSIWSRVDRNRKANAGQSETSAMASPWRRRDDGLPPRGSTPCSDTWTSVSELVRKFSEHYGTTQLLMDLALGRVEKCPFPSESVRELKGEIIGLLSSRGLNLYRAEW